MSFSETELGTLQEILEIPAFDLNIVLDRATITTEVETLIRADVTAWPTYRDSFVSIEPNTRNFGARMNSDANRQAIKARIANWLNMPMPSANVGLVRC